MPRDERPEAPWEPMLWIYSPLWWPNDRRSGAVVKWTRRLNQENTADCTVGLAFHDDVSTSHRIYGGPKPNVGIRDVPIFEDHPPEPHKFEFYGVPCR